MIQFKNVTKSFDRIVLKNISLDFPEGKIIGLFGPNGAGKSTTMKLIMGLVYPDSGKVLIDGKTPLEKKKDLAFLPEINHLPPRWTLGQAKDFVKAFYDDWDESRYKEQQEFLRLSDDMKLSRISKGQLAKCKLLLTVSRRAPYLLMDEPFSGIDILTREEIVSALIDDYSRTEQTILISTHEIGEIENLVDYVIFIDDTQFKIMDEADRLRDEKGMSIANIMKEAFRDGEE